MAENFGGSLNLIIWIVLTLGAIYYSYRCLFQTKAFNDQYGFGDQAIFITRFAGSGKFCCITPDLRDQVAFVHASSYCSSNRIQNFK